ncbi:hypothetical protein P389DRAFT_174631 [Cystobasidium minutum MCA 4210]|uniref:uncharacterized protein n=1 Tax=Cystobasidium minutum MCA 4210 TaxID=1397322 RepID=UPI0034CDC373|eukprot:jgi/Rhomi1/174631/fgenesh1_kg.8_\
MTLLMLPNVLLEDILSLALRDRTKSPWPSSSRNRLSDLCLVHKKINLIAQKLVWRSLVLDTPSQMRLVNYVADWTEQELSEKLSRIEGVHIEVEGLLTARPDGLRYMRLTNLLIGANLSRFMAEKLVNRIDTSRLRVIAIDNLARSFPSQVNDFRNLLIKSASTLEKLYVHCLSEDVAHDTSATLPQFRRLRVLSVKLLLDVLEGPSLFQQILANAPRIQKVIVDPAGMSVKRLLSGCPGSLSTLVLAGAEPSLEEALSVAPPELKELKIINIFRQALSISSSFPYSLPEQLQVLEVQSIWCCELITFLTTNLAQSWFLPQLSVLRIDDQRIRLRCAAGWQGLYGQCQQRGIKLQDSSEITRTRAFPIRP